MASCSRDSTVRLWSLTPLISPLLLKIITDQPWEKIIGNTGRDNSDVFCFMMSTLPFISDDMLCVCVSADTAMVPASPPLLCGKVSRDIKQELDKLNFDIKAKKLRWFSECFSVTTLWMLLHHWWCANISKLGTASDNSLTSVLCVSVYAACVFMDTHPCVHFYSVSASRRQQQPVGPGVGH